MSYTGSVVDIRPSVERASRSTVLAIAGDSGAGKTTLARGIRDALGYDRCTLICSDHYHRWDRAERARQNVTPLNPDANHLDVFEQDLLTLSRGEPVLRPSYDHSTGRLGRPVEIAPREYVIVEGLLPLHSRGARRCVDVSAYLDQPEDLRRLWKLDRDTTGRGHTKDDVLAELDRRQQDSELYVKPQRDHANIVVTYRHTGRWESRHDALSAELYVRGALADPLLGVVAEDPEECIHLTVGRDHRNRPANVVFIHGYTPSEVTQQLTERIWARLKEIAPDFIRPPALHQLGRVKSGDRSEPLALTQLILLYQLLVITAEGPAR